MLPLRSSPGRRLGLPCNTRSAHPWHLRSQVPGQFASDVVTTTDGHAEERANGEYDVEKNPEAIFGFRVRNIFEMSQWKMRTTLRLLAQDDLLGITEVQLRSEIQAVGYDPSKIDGYDENLIAPMYGWKISTHYNLWTSPSSRNYMIRLSTKDSQTCSLTSA